MVSVRRHARHWRAYLAHGRSVLKENWIVISFTALSTVFVLGLFGSSKAFQECFKDHKNSPAYHGLHQSISLFVKDALRVRLHIACGLSDEGVWLVISGIAVAVFTFTLWRSTLLLWQAGEKQITAAQTAANAANLSAQAAVAGIAKPQLFIKDVKKDRWELQGSSQPNAIPIMNNFMFDIINHGNTYAVISSVEIDFIVNDGRGIGNVTGIHHFNIYPEYDLGQTALREKESITFRRRVTIWVTVLKKEGEALLATDIYMVIKVKYVDPYNNRWERSFIQTLNVRRGPSAAVHNPDHDYNRLEQT